MSIPSHSFFIDSADLAMAPSLPAGAVSVTAADLPEAARPLLDHERGMTATLEAAWDETMALEVLDAHEVGECLARTVLLYGADSGRPVELGRIVIHLPSLPECIHEPVRGGILPFGTLLAQAGVAFRSRPDGFFRIPATAPDLAALPALAGCTGELFGRTARVSRLDGTLLAEVTEILTALPARD
ncbi:hypothetical protein [Rhodocista pekingensis]|uniref:Uncharacterized protein n=1 Tax=Rhodocista pekingensis TaxID=201185 RepID=A0ABW2KQ12_9PROT